MKMVVIAAVVVFILDIGIARSQAQAETPAPLPAPSAAPVNPDATPEARELLKRIDAISGHYTLTGQHNFPNHLSRWSDRIYDLTGKFPAIFGSDFGFAGGEDKDSVLGRPGMIDEAKRQYRNGAVIALCWHEVRPTDDEPVTFRESVQGKLTDFEWNELLTPGTDLNKRWVEQVDVVAGYLKQLQDAGVPVLFRPYHEMNGNWFWWGGRAGEKGSAALYRQLFDRFVHVHHLNNLIWVWNSDRPSGSAGKIADFYPGAQYVDVVTIDIYGEFLQSYYDTMLSIAGDKPVALGEVGAMPSLEVIAKQPRWAYFMVWSEMEASNPLDQLQAVYHAPNMLNRGDAPFVPLVNAPGVPMSTPMPMPVTPQASKQAKALLERLHAAGPASGLASGGTQILSGQQNDAASPTAASDLVSQASGKQPAVYAVELDAAHAQAVLDAAISQAKAGSVVSLTWMAQNPADEEDAGHNAAAPSTPRPGNAGPNAAGPSSGSSSGQKRLLSDFEWQELLTPGTHLNKRWGAQVDEMAELLKRLDAQGVAVLFTPYPEPNGKQFWWANRPGIHGSAALYRMLFDRLVNQDHVKNVIWGWQAAPGGFGPQANGPATDYFPGLLYVDAVSVAVSRLNPQFRTAAIMKRLAGDKPMGVTIAAGVPDPAAFNQDSSWSWFELAPITAAPDDVTALALKTLYGDAKIVSRQGQQE